MQSSHIGGTIFCDSAARAGGGLRKRQIYRRMNCSGRCSSFDYEGYRLSMANHVSALKRARQTVTKTAFNRANKSRMRSALRNLRTALTSGDKTTLDTTFRETVSVLDKSVQKGILHKNTASRYKSRLSARVKAATATLKPFGWEQTAGFGLPFLLAQRSPVARIAITGERRSSACARCGPARCRGFFPGGRCGGLRRRAFPARSARFAWRRLRRGCGRRG